MTADQKIIKNRLGLLELAGQRLASLQDPCLQSGECLTLRLVL